MIAIECVTLRRFSHSPTSTHTRRWFALHHYSLFQTNFKPLHQAADAGNKLCIALLLLASDSILGVRDKHGRTPVDSARNNNKHDSAAAMEKWASGDKAGALRDLGAAHLVSSLSSLPPSSRGRRRVRLLVSANTHSQHFHLS